MALSDDLERIAAHAATFAGPGERVAGILAAETTAAGRVYLCAFERDGGERAWLALDGDARPVPGRETVREAVQLAALCEVAEENAGGGDLPQLRARLAEIREHEAPAGIEEAELAAAALAATLQDEPRLATTDYLDRLGAASRRLEHALGEETGSPFASAVQQALQAVEELTAEIAQHHKVPLA
jgi:hypothetical protein